MKVEIERDFFFDEIEPYMKCTLGKLLPDPLRFDPSVQKQ